MFGGTPSNLAISVMNGGKTEVIAGINLPMLIKLASVRGEMRRSTRPSSRRRRPAANTSTSPARCWRANERLATRPCTDAQDLARTPSRMRLPARAHPRGRAGARDARSSTARACTPAPRRSSCNASRSFDAEVKVTRCGETVGGTSIMGILTLGAGIGTTITVTADGEQAPGGARRAGRTGREPVRRGRVGARGARPTASRS